MVILTAFSDMMRVPGDGGSAARVQSTRGRCAVGVFPAGRAKNRLTEPRERSGFFAIGFEATTPSTALTLMTAKSEGVGNFSVFCNYIVPPAPVAVVVSGFALRDLLQSVGLLLRQLRHRKPKVVNNYARVVLDA